MILGLLITRCTPRVFLLGFLLLLLSACATPDPAPRALGSGLVTPVMLLEESPIARTGQLSDFSGVDILGVSPDMADFVDRHIDTGMSTDRKVRELVSAIMDNDNFRVDYEDNTRTAAETFQDRSGNCLSFTNMFIAMARYTGLEANFQEVDIPPDWSLVGHTFLLSEHINAIVNTVQGSKRMIDFNTQTIDFYVQRLSVDSIYEMHVVSDARAFAHYFNNQGAEYMLQGGNTLLALSAFYESIRQDPEFSSVWVNLGILHRRDGYPEYAEAAYLHALALDSSNLVAMSNLANLYAAEGLVEQADHYRSQVRYHRLKNPYYLYALAGSAVKNGDHEAASDYLNRAIQIRDSEPRFYSLMSVNYFLMGENDAAIQWMTKAEEAAVQMSERERYNRKLEVLGQHDRDSG